MLNAVALQFTNGNALFAGLPLAVISCALLVRRWGRVWLTLWRVAAVTGGLMVLLSATPFPLWAYILWCLCLAACLAVSGTKRPTRTPLLITTVLLALVSAAMLAVEVPYHKTPTLDFPKDRPLIIVGDSLSMALELDATAWPYLLAENTDYEVVRKAYGGNTVHGSMSYAKEIHDTEASVLLEIGGNDLLKLVSVDEFEADLAAFLDEVCVPGRTVAMFELPLIPLWNGFGRVQREQAKQRGIILIPKRYMTRVLGGPGATVDGLHLSKSGHEHMAETLAELFPAQGE